MRSVDAVSRTPLLVPVSTIRRDRTARRLVEPGEVVFIEGPFEANHLISS